MITSELEAMRPFARLIAEELHAIMEQRGETRGPESQVVYRGIPGIMTIFQCSRRQATRIRQSGVIDSAITETPGGKIFLVNKDKAMAALERWRKRGGRL